MGNKMFESSITSSVINRRSPGCVANANVVLGYEIMKTRAAPGARSFGIRKGKGVRSPGKLYQIMLFEKYWFVALVGGAVALLALIVHLLNKKGLALKS